jgi:hypothetical protein
MSLRRDGHRLVDGRAQVPRRCSPVVADRDGAVADRHPGLDLGRGQYVVARHQARAAAASFVVPHSLHAQRTPVRSGWGSVSCLLAPGAASNTASYQSWSPSGSALVGAKMPPAGLMVSPREGCNDTWRSDPAPMLGNLRGLPDLCRAYEARLVGDVGMRSSAKKFDGSPSSRGGGDSVFRQGLPLSSQRGLAGGTRGSLTGAPAAALWCFRRVGTTTTRTTEPRVRGPQVPTRAT